MGGGGRYEGGEWEVFEKLLNPWELSQQGPYDIRSYNIYGSPFSLAQKYTKSKVVRAFYREDREAR